MPWSISGQDVGVGRLINNADSNDTWYSSDGVNWTQVAANFTPRSRHTAVVFNNKIWLSKALKSNTQ